MNDAKKVCRFCGKVLRSKASIERGYGEICFQRHVRKRSGGLFEQIAKRKGTHSDSDKTVPSKVLQVSEA